MTCIQVEPEASIPPSDTAALTHNRRQSLQWNVAPFANEDRPFGPCEGVVDALLRGRRLSAMIDHQMVRRKNHDVTMER